MHIMAVSIFLSFLTSTSDFLLISLVSMVGALLMKRPESLSLGEPVALRELDRLIGGGDSGSAELLREMLRGVVRLRKRSTTLGS